MNEADYVRYFTEEYRKHQRFSDLELWQRYDDFGEVDASALVRLLKYKEVVANISINLLHNGFARRTWVTPGHDLYKGNGRVKHEYHNIQQGPFQNIQIHSYQSNDKHDTNTLDDYHLGGNNHFDIYVFRNIGMVGGKKPLEVIHINDIKDTRRLDTGKLVTEQIKHRVVVEFLDFIAEKISKDNLTSNIDDHMVPVQIMSGLYQSNIRQRQSKNPVIRFNLT